MKVAMRLLISFVVKEFGAEVAGAGWQSRSGRASGPRIGEEARSSSDLLLWNPPPRGWVFVTMSVLPSARKTYPAVVFDGFRLWRLSVFAHPVHVPDGIVSV